MEDSTNLPAPAVYVHENADGLEAALKQMRVVLGSLEEEQVRV